MRPPPPKETSNCGQILMVRGCKNYLHLRKNGDNFMSQKKAYERVERGSRARSVGIALGYGLDDRGSRIRFLGGRLGIFLFTTVSRTALGLTQSPIQWAAGALSLGVKRTGREADHSPQSSAEGKNAWSYTSTPQYVYMAWCLVKHRDNFTFYLLRVERCKRTDGRTDECC
jgi:hypothetical protein